MEGRRSRSKKPSDPRSPRPPDWTPTFFVDASLGHRVVAKLRAAGLRVLGHDEVFPQGTEDRVWLTRAGREGWIVLTKDQAIRYKPSELLALQRARVGQFVLATGNLTAEQMVEAFLAARDKMVKVARTTKTSFVARLNRAGNITTVKKLAG